MPSNEYGRSDWPRQSIAGVVTGFDNLGRAIAMASLVFAGTLSAGAPLAVMVFLISGIIGTGTLLLNRFFVGPVFSNVQNTTLAILLPATLVIGTAPLSPDAQIVTVFALLGATAILTGIAMLLIASFNLARFIQLVPFPVTSGYLAATGALLVASAVRMICNGDACGMKGGQWAGLTPSLTPSLGALLLALGFAGVIWGGTRLWPKFGLVGVIFVALAGFYVVLALIGVDLATVRSSGFLPGAVQQAPTFTPRPALIAQVEWELILTALPTILAAVVVSLFSAMLNITGVELVLKRDLDTRAELGRLGVINIVTGLFGGAVNFISASNTTAAALLGAAGRLTGVATCIVLGAAILFAGDIFAFVPSFISGGLLIFFGASILNTWWFMTRNRQSLPEWLLGFAIIVASLTVGMSTAVAMGIMAASLIFAVSYARLPVVRATSDLSVLRSAVDRGRKQAKYLRKHGGEVAVVTLQGFLFFGSIERLTTHIRELFRTEEKLTTIILDFSRVSRMDASSIAALNKLEILAAHHDAHVVLAEPNPEVRRDLIRSHVVAEDGRLSIAPTTDLAMEEAENALVARMRPDDTGDTALSSLTSLLGDATAAARLFAEMTREEVAQGTRIVTQGEVSGDVFLLEEGMLSVMIRTESGDALRVMKQRPGAIVGEIAAYAGVPRTADVVADTPVVVYRLSQEKLGELQQSAPEIAANWHKAMASGLAEKLDRTNKILGQRAL